MVYTSNNIFIIFLLDPQGFDDRGHWPLRLVGLVQ